MMRVIVTPATLPPAALAELKQWLGITTANDDAPLTALLRMAMDVFTGFTGLLPISCLCEELITLKGNETGGNNRLSTFPVRKILTLQGTGISGPRVDMLSDSYTGNITPEGIGYVKVIDGLGFDRFYVRFVAGYVTVWESLPDAIRHGIIRLAAHQHRGRENVNMDMLPPAAVAALWQPWRRMRLA